MVSGGKVAGWLLLARLIDGICWFDGSRVSWFMGWLYWLMAGWVAEGGGFKKWVRGWREALSACL